MLQQTSLLAYLEIKTKLGEKQQRVLETLKELGEATNSELAEQLGWSINRVTPRTNELVKAYKVTQAGKRNCNITGKKCIAWRINQ